MSLDLSPIGNCLLAGTFAAAITTPWPATADLSDEFGTGGNFIEVFVDTSAGDVILTPDALVDANGFPIKEGDHFKFINVGGGGALIWNDATGISYSFADQEGEFICLKALGTVDTAPDSIKSYVVI